MKIAPPPRSIASLVTAYNDFGFRLFTHLTRQDVNQNIFISPFSIAVALTMTLNGAAHETQPAMAGTLGLGQRRLAEVNGEAAALLTALTNLEPEVQLLIANSLWVELGLSLKPQFIECNQNFYRAEVRSIDFAAPETAATINGWVAAQTCNKIPQLIQPEDFPALTALILINALYFKGSWTQPFDAKRTQARAFTLLDGSIKQHPLMSQTGEYRYYEDEAIQAVSLPYGAGRVSLYVILPKPESVSTDLHVKLTAQNWRHWLAEFHPQPGSILLPRFKLEYGQKLNAVLMAMGMESAFSPGLADFSQLCDVSLWIDKVIHKTFVEVNEEGTEAAAATAVMMARGSPPHERFQLRVDRPFFCAIVDDQTGAILFMGSIVDPPAA